MLRSEKPIVIDELVKIYKESHSVIVAHYHGLTVGKISSLRRFLQDNDSGFKVVKNTLAKIAADKAGLKDFTVLFSGPTAIAYSKEPVGIAKTIVEFAKANDNFKIIGAIVENQILNENSIQELSKLPSLNELRGKTVGILQAPASKIVGVIQAPALSLVRVLKAYASKN